MYNTERGVSSLNFRKDIFERMTYIVKTETNKKPNYAKLARQFNCDYRTVKQYYEAASQGVKQLHERKIQKKTDGFEQIIEEKLKTGAPAIAIYNYLRDEKGFTGSYSTIKQYIHDYHRLQQHRAVIRFETTPGLQAQIDWKESLRFKTKSGDEIKFNVFLLILGFSRFKFLMVTESRDRMQVEFCLACAFKKIGGVPREILFDNMRSIIDMARTQYADPVFNQEFLQFAADAGFKAKACMAYRPETKGKVEVTAKLMNRLKIYDGDIDSFEDIKRIVAKLNEDLNDEVCQGTGVRPNDRIEIERKYLIKTDLSCLNAYFEKPVRRKVSRESMITYCGRKYSVPTAYIGKYVDIVENGFMEFDISYEGTVVRHWKVTNKLFNYNHSDYHSILRSGSLKDLEESEINEIAERNLKIYDEL
jgi:transposase